MSARPNSESVSRSPFLLTADTLYDLLEVNPEQPLRHLVHVARGVRGVFPPLVLSLAARDGATLGTGARDELRRMAERSTCYERLAQDLTSMDGVRVIKGPSLARHYPPELIRPVGDLDVVAPDEASLWRAAHRVLRKHPVTEVDLSVIRDGQRRHLLLSLWWPAADPLLDKGLRVEISTFAFAGEPGVVPLRSNLPDDQAVADLLALAEERFQRPFTAKDLIDLTYALTAPTAPDPDALALAADNYRLSPELLELGEAVLVHPALAPAVPAALLDRLRSLTPAEVARRGDRRPLEQLAKADQSVEERLAQGLPAYGFSLSGAPRIRDQKAMTWHDVGGIVIARTPVADFLMVTGEVVDPDRHDIALHWLNNQAELTQPHRVRDHHDPTYRTPTYVQLVVDIGTRL
ncbi:hypothetical protein [Pilimelia columellifera]|uniref:Uncharacterized protein n=1 Tax=Pilimelia columellifera subsp. columellifera TaxID=706583 RepID=A0ABN3NSW1_9ACTN